MAVKCTDLHSRKFTNSSITENLLRLLWQKTYRLPCGRKPTDSPVAAYLLILVWQQTYWPSQEKKLTHSPGGRNCTDSPVVKKTYWIYCNAKLADFSHDSNLTDGGKSKWWQKTYNLCHVRKLTAFPVVENSHVTENRQICSSWVPAARNDIVNHKVTLYNHGWQKGQSQYSRCYTSVHTSIFPNNSEWSQSLCYDTHGPCCLCLPYTCSLRIWLHKNKLQSLVFAATDSLLY